MNIQVYVLLLTVTFIIWTINVRWVTLTTPTPWATLKTTMWPTKVLHQLLKCGYNQSLKSPTSSQSLSPQDHRCQLLEHSS